MDVATQRTVRNRARNQCEYCQLPQTATPFLTFHVEHIQAKQHVSEDSLDNLALAFPDCNRFKGPNLTSLSSITRKIIRLFHPRNDQWSEHFEYESSVLVGLRPIGEATIDLLQINSDEQMKCVLHWVPIGRCERKLNSPNTTTSSTRQRDRWLAAAAREPSDSKLTFG